MSELEQYIKSCFGELSKEDLESIQSFFKKKIVKKGEFVLRAGEECKQLCFVQSGLLRMFVSTDEKEVTQWISSKGYFATDLTSFVFNSSAKINIQALVDTEIFSISKENYQAIGKKVSNWHQIEKLFLIKCFSILEDRVLSHLSLTSEERYEKFFSRHSELFNQVPLHFIASMLGMTPETFSRIRRKQLS